MLSRSEANEMMREQTLRDHPDQMVAMPIPVKPAWWQYPNAYHRNQAMSNDRTMYDPPSTPNEAPSQTTARIKPFHPVLSPMFPVVRTSADGKVTHPHYGMTRLDYFVGQLMVGRDISTMTSDDCRLIVKRAKMMCDAVYEHEQNIG